MRIITLIGGKMNERIRAYSYLYPLKNHDLNSGINHAMKELSKWLIKKI